MSDRADFGGTAATMDQRLPPVIHVSPNVLTHGGIQTLLTLHRPLPVAQRFVAFFDRGPVISAGYQYQNLDFTWRTPLWQMRRRFARALAPYPGALVIYHNGWGLPLFHDLDGASRRMVALHVDPAYHAAELPYFSGLIDAAQAINPAVQAVVDKILPELAGCRSSFYRVPIESPTSPIIRPMGRPLTLGYAGRVVRAHKRLDRLPAFLQAMRAAGREFRFEVIGDGAYRPALERELAGQAHFHGWLSRADYWRAIARWDAMVFFSDNEGGPIALLEGMAAGALPFYPAQRGSWADVYTPQVNPLCHYPPGDMPALAAAIGRIFALPAVELEALRACARALVAPHTAEQYQAACLEAFRNVWKLPRLSVPRARWPRPTDLLPLGAATRVAPWALRRA